MAIGPVQGNSQGPNLQALGLKSPMEVIDILSVLKIDGAPVINDDKAFLDPNLKAQSVINFFKQNFNVSPNELPHLAAAIKHDLRHGRINWEG
ncbi:MAG: hypothetical protein ACPL4K_02750 [Candidatus Margulisiibacteriota bacterium]